MPEPIERIADALDLANLIAYLRIAEVDRGGRDAFTNDLRENVEHRLEAMVSGRLVTPVGVSPWGL